MKGMEMRYYSNTTGGFYHSAIHGEALPADAVEISEASYRALRAGLAAGQQIHADSNGRPALVARPAPSVDELAAQVRAERDHRLRAQVDSVNAVRWAAMNDAEQQAWSTFRQALLDVPQQTGFPHSIDWPVQP